MDGDMAGLALLRARQETLLGQNQQLSRLLALTQGQQALTDTMLSHARQELNVAMDMVSNATWELAGMKQELSKVQQHVSDMQRELAAVQGCCNADNTSSADSGKTMAAMTETNRELLETKDKLAVVMGDLTKVQRELGDVRRCCGTKDTFTTDTTFQKGPQTSYSPPEDKTSSSHESTSSMWNEMTSAEPASFVTKQNFAQITQELTSFQSQADKSWQDLSEHINVVEMSLKQYKGKECCQVKGK
ncbi:uncharacterized protein LOC143298532 [Babylonia areolata]|uniref:uncharacterized protein LOC143298532 n=1 Tax=Babylonia areolata TaxID=304850 RepID=UPI003FD0E75A